MQSGCCHEHTSTFGAVCATFLFLLLVNAWRHRHSHHYAHGCDSCDDGCGCCDEEEADEATLYHTQGMHCSHCATNVERAIRSLDGVTDVDVNLSAGTARERNRYRNLIPISRHYNGMFRIVGGKAMAYFMIYAVMTAYLVLVVPRMFSFTAIGRWQDLLGFLLPYVLDCIFFGMVVSCMVRYRENVMLLMVFVTLPLLFLSGVSWPQSSIPGFWQGVSWLFPSTFGIRGFVCINEMGGTLSDVLPECRILWLQTLVYFILACLVYRYQIFLARRDARERLAEMKEHANPLDS